MSSNKVQTGQQSGSKIAVFADDRPPVMVISHERSGTHFLMNSIARAYGYTSKPWLDLDQHQIQLNYFYPPSIAEALEYFASQRIASIVKSHHSAAFFDGVLDRILRRYVVFYIHRDPVEVMQSFWRFMHGWHWHEGPKCADVLTFAAAEPEGHMLRYQTHQRRNMLDRWAHHVQGWHDAARGQPRLRLVPYAALKNDYAATISDFAEVLGRQPADLSPPSPDVNVIKGGAPVLNAPTDIAALRALALQEIGDTMKAMGYST